MSQSHKGLLSVWRRRRGRGGHKVVIYESDTFYPGLADLSPNGSPPRLRLYCERCERHHNIQWEELRSAVKTQGATSAQAVIDAWASKYCFPQGSASPTPRTKDRGRTRRRKLAQVREILEAMHPDVFVSEGRDNRDGTYSLKLYTPRGGHLGTATLREWKALVAKDIERSHEPDRCICGSERLHHDEGWLVCEDCGRVGWIIEIWSNTDNFSPHPLLERYFPSLTPGGLWSLFLELATGYEAPDFITSGSLAHGAKVVWFDLPGLMSVIESEAASAFDEKIALVRGPLWPAQPVSGKVPVYLMEEDMPDSASRAWNDTTDRQAFFETHWRARWLRGEADFLVPVDCSSCQHHWNPGTYKGDPDIAYCVYPATPDWFTGDGISHMHGPWDDGYNESFCCGQLCRMHSEWLKDDLFRRLKGILWHPIGADHVTLTESGESMETILCPNYAPDRAHADCYLYALDSGMAVEAIIGVRSLTEAWHQAEHRRLGDLTDALRDRLREALADPSVGAMLAVRITKENLDSPAAEALIAKIAALLQPDECRDTERLRRGLLEVAGLLNLSNAARPILVNRIIERCHAAISNNLPTSMP